ncbi:MAG: hypothetical protein NTW94_04550 [Legionellales bacterium]|nr:hypothetical protein [Legionellales bacterium]
MDIIFQGRHDGDEALESLQSVVRLFQERYKIGHFREMHLSVTLVDDQGEDVELIDSDTQEVYRIFEVYRQGLPETRAEGRPRLKLVIDNSRS